MNHVGGGVRPRDCFAAVHIDLSEDELKAAMEAMVEVTAGVVGDNILSLMLAVRRMKPLKDRLLGTLERLPKILIE